MVEQRSNREMPDKILGFPPQTIGSCMDHELRAGETSPRAPTECWSPVENAGSAPQSTTESISPLPPVRATHRLTQATRSACHASLPLRSDFRLPVANRWPGNRNVPRHGRCRRRRKLGTSRSPNRLPKANRSTSRFHAHDPERPGVLAGKLIDGQLGHVNHRIAAGGL